jgi:zinc protease
MRNSFALLFFFLCLIVSSCTQEKKESKLTVSNEKYSLANGLTVILNEDKSDPIASLVIFYHVGSNREVIGKTGFAHLFEHMMFQRSENVGEDQFFKYIEGAGGELNGGTDFDQTVYYEVVPKNALELAMWLESDRMGYLINTVTSSSFQQQQNVVQNEKREGVDNMPYGFTDYVILKNLYPKGHPYSWDVIGEMEDLKNSTIEDVKAFHNKFYIPNNATLVVSGDYNKDSVKLLIEKYFGEIPAGQPVKTPEPMNITLGETKKLFHEDNFAKAPQFNMVYPTIQQFTKDAYSLDVLAQLLGDGKKSPLYKVLVKDKKLTSGVAAYNNSMELTGRFNIRITANPSTSLDDVEKGIFEAYDKFEKEKFTEDDLIRIKAQLEINFYNRISSILYKSFMLAYYNVMAGSPDYLVQELDKMKSVTSQDVWDVYDKYIKGKNYVATSFVPKGEANLIAKSSINAGIVEEDITKATEVAITKTAKEDKIEKTSSKFDRSKPPVFGPDPQIKLPVVWNSTSQNGMKIHGIEQHELPILSYSIVIKGGHKLDDINKPGVARYMAQMLNEGTKLKTPEELEDAIKTLGGDVSVYGGDEDITVSVNTLSRNFEKTVNLVEEMLLQPRWDTEQFAINKTRTINNLKRNKANPNYLAWVAYDSLLMGKDNILSKNVTGTVSSVESITMDDLKAFYQKAVSPSVAEFMIVGDVDQARVEKALAGLNKDWKGVDVTMPSLSFPPTPEKGSIYFVDVPGAKQSVIQIGYLALPRTSPDYYKAVAANYMLGGGASAKLFMTLREEKGYTYGAYSGFSGNKTYGTFYANSSVRSDATFESLKLFKDIMLDYRKGVTQDIVNFTKGSLLKANALKFETNYSLLYMLQTMKLNDLPEDYIKQEEDYLSGLTVDKVNETVKKYIDPMRMYYVVVGDAKTQFKGLEKVGLGTPVLLKK